MNTVKDISREVVLMLKRLQINCRSNPYIEALIVSVMEKEGIKKTEVIHKAIEFYALHLLDLEEIMNIQMSQRFNK